MKNSVRLLSGLVLTCFATSAVGFSETDKNAASSIKKITSTGGDSNFNHETHKLANGSGSKASKSGKSNYKVDISASSEATFEENRSSLEVSGISKNSQINMSDTANSVNPPHF